MTSPSIPLSGFDLSSRAMLTSLTIRAWGGSKLDRSETARVADQNHAARDAVRVTKDLVGNKLNEVRSSERQIRETHRKYTLPWADDATRLLPTKVWEEYNPLIVALITHHTETVIPAFAKRYHTEVIPSARERLQGLFNPADFPDDIESRFGVTLRYLPVPVSSDVRVQLSKEEVASLQQEVETATRDAYRLANEEILDRASKPMLRLAEALTDYKPGKRLSDALLANVAEIAALIPALNISGSPVVDDLAQQIGDLVADLDTESLSASRRARSRVAGKVVDLNAKLAAIF